MVLGVYAIVTLALGNWSASVCALALATALIGLDRYLAENDELEKLWASIRALQTLSYQVHRTAEDLKMENQHILKTTKEKIDSLKSEVKERIGSLAGDVSKVQQSNDPWSNNP